MAGNSLSREPMPTITSTPKAGPAKLAYEENVYEARVGGHLPALPVRHRVIDLFAGAGGMTAGFSKFLGHNFESVWANDFNRWAADTYNANFGDHCTFGDIVDILNDPKTRIPKADVVVGGPPCQGFSLLNKNRVGDPRKELWRPYMEVVERSGASIFVMENVPQILASVEFEMIAEHAERLGFKLTYGKVCAADYGVPQTRWRAIVIGCKFRSPEAVFPPKKTHYDPRELEKDQALLRKGDYVKKAKPWRTVRDAIANLKAPVGTEIRPVASPNNLQFGRNPTKKSLMRYKAIPKEGMNRVDLHERAPQLTPDCWVRKKSGGTDLFGRLWWDRPAVTMRTEFYKPEKGRYLHPQQHRPITHREAARFQSFPDNFVFKGNKIEVARQIGNAVPPMLAARLADVVYALLAGKGSIR
jgi:DNA (cytosine-5)-methyltransferase 1